MSAFKGEDSFTARSAKRHLLVHGDTKLTFPRLTDAAAHIWMAYSASMIFWGFVLAVVAGGFLASFVASITGALANGMGNQAGVAVGRTTWIATFVLIFRKMMRTALRESRAYRENAYRQASYSQLRGGRL